MQFCLPINEWTGIEISFFEDLVEISTVDLDKDNENKDTISMVPESFNTFVELLNQVKNMKDYVDAEAGLSNNI
jgi:hypothetical protein